MSFTTIIWEWDFHKETEKLSTLYSAGDALSFLSSSSYVQKNSIGGCPFCEVWNEQCCDVLKFIDELHGLCDETTFRYLTELKVVFDSLSEKEIQCGTTDIFDTKGWSKIRDLSSEVLNGLEWNLLDGFRRNIESL